MTQIILGDMPPELPPLVASETATETIWQVALEQSKYWKNIDPKACEPIEGESLWIDYRPWHFDSKHLW